MLLGDEYCVDYVVLDLLRANNFTGFIQFEPNLLAVVGFGVNSVDIRDVNPLAPTNQANWVLKCLQIGGTSKMFYRYNGVMLSNIVKIFSRNVLSQSNPFPPDFMLSFDAVNMTRLDFQLTNIDGTAPDVNATTVGIQFVLVFLRNKFI